MKVLEKKILSTKEMERKKERENETGELHDVLTRKRPANS